MLRSHVIELGEVGGRKEDLNQVHEGEERADVW